MQPHRQQPTRLSCPWDSPGKNTGVGCHFLLQCMKVKSESEVSCVLPSATPWTAAFKAPLSMGFSRQEYWSGVPLPSPVIYHYLGINIKHNLEWVFAIQSLSSVRFFETPQTAAHQASLSFSISLGLLKLISIESVMPSNHLILCSPLLLLASIFPSTRIFSNEVALHIRGRSIGASAHQSFH